VTWPDFQMEAISSCNLLKSGRDGRLTGYRNISFPTEAVFFT
jgi:hypothetical protein